MKTIRIASDFSDTPWGRFDSDGPFNGTRFREELLKPALQEEDEVIVELDGTEGYGSSFLEEAFGGLIRKNQFSVSDLRNRLKIACTDPANTQYEPLIWTHIEKAGVESVKNPAK